MDPVPSVFFGCEVRRPRTKVEGSHSLRALEDVKQSEALDIPRQAQNAMSGMAFHDMFPRLVPMIVSVVLS